MVDHDYKLMALSGKQMVFLFIYYVILTLGSVSLFFALFYNSIPNRTNLVGTVILFSIAGSAIYNFRKLYKAAINDDYDFNTMNTSISQIATIFFFLFRPIFSLVFALIVLFIWMSTIDFSTDETYLFNGESIYLVAIIGFAVGYNLGRLIERFSIFSEQFIKSNVSDKL